MILQIILVGSLILVVYELASFSGANAEILSYEQIPTSTNGVISSKLRLVFESPVVSSIIDSFKLRFPNGSEILMQVRLKDTSGHCSMLSLGSMCNYLINSAASTQCLQAACDYPACQLPDTTPPEIQHTSTPYSSCFLGTNGHLCRTDCYTQTPAGNCFPAFRVDTEDCFEQGFMTITGTVPTADISKIQIPQTFGNTTIRVLSIDHTSVNLGDNFIIQGNTYRVAPKKNFCFFANGDHTCLGPVMRHGVVDTILVHARDRVTYDSVKLWLGTFTTVIHNPFITATYLSSLPSVSDSFPLSTINNGVFTYDLDGVHSIRYTIDFDAAFLFETANDCFIKSASGVCKEVNDLRGVCKLEIKTEGTGYVEYTIGGERKILSCGIDKSISTTVAMNSNVTELCYITSGFKRDCVSMQVEWDYEGIDEPDDGENENVVSKALNYLRKHEAWVGALWVAFGIIVVLGLAVGFGSVYYGVQLCACTEYFGVKTGSYTDI